MKKSLSLFALLFVLQLAAYAQTLDEKLKEIDDYANTVMTTWRGPGMAIAIVKDDKVVFAKGYGVRELGKNEPGRRKHPVCHRIQFKSVHDRELAILVDEKKIAWDDKVSKYLPDFKMYDPWVTQRIDDPRHRFASRRARYIQR